MAETRWYQELWQDVLLLPSFIREVASAEAAAGREVGAFEELFRDMVRAPFYLHSEISAFWSHSDREEMKMQKTTLETTGDFASQPTAGGSAEVP